MARRRKRRKKRTRKAFVLNTYKLGGFFIILGGLYFFAYLLAQDSPLLQLFHAGAFVVFGEIGTIPFFALSIVVGLLFLWRSHMTKRIVHQFLVVLILLSAIFNFPLVDDPGLSYEQYGGYISWPLLWALDSMFGSEATAIKAFVVILFVLWGIRVITTYKLRMPLPRIQLEDSGTSSSTGSSSKKTNHSGSLLGGLISSGIRRMKEKREQKRKEKKLARLTNTGAGISTTSRTSSSSSAPSPSSGSSLVKDIFKQSLSKKVDEKVHQKTAVKIDYPKDKPTFSTSLMPGDNGMGSGIDETFLIKNARALQDKLMEFKVPVTIDGFDIGPTVVQVRVRPEAGIKVSAIESLKNDIALSMKTKSLRIICPIPGTDCVGIQIPNPKGKPVYLGDVLKSQDFSKAMHKNLTNMALGVSIDNTNIIKRLDAMPHALIAGATGSGKSVGVNGMILSLMYQNSPAELKFLMIDPKQVEMELYSGLPYLLAPIVTRPEKALKVLQWSVEEMETRYTKLKKSKTKKLAQYNRKHPEDKMYRIVIVIDELADLMMSGNKKEVELCITRIAQKARAVGMHLIIATQRPSVNVLTGLIKANVPTRISFGVVSQVDSRTILGQKGAEDLLGKGDMLYMDTTTKFPVRMQSPFVDTPETEKIIASLQDKYMKGLSEEDVYHPEIVRILEGKVELASDLFSGGKANKDEELIQEAIQIIAKSGKASATMLQRKLNVGFARAARILDALEEKGIVGPQEGAKAREVLI